MSAESHYFHAVSEAIIGWGNASSLLGGFICSRVVAISQCVAPSNIPVPLWFVFGVCVCECLEVSECVGMIINRSSDEKPMLKWLLGLEKLDLGVKCQRGICFSFIW